MSARYLYLYRTPLLCLKLAGIFGGILYLILIKCIIYQTVVIYWQ